jgi:hypothetical protein
MRLRTITYLLLVGLVCASGCAKKMYPETAEVNFISAPQSGVATLSAIGYGSDQKEAELDTYTTVFNNVLFKGIPAFGGLNLPMVENEQASRSAHQSFYKKFFDERGYMRFISSQGGVEKMGKSDDKQKTKVKKTMTLNYDLLRRYLEDEGIIRKFGY